MKAEKFRIGWREWASLPTLKIAKIKVKVDTGARTSALHVSEIEQFRERGRKMVRFVVHPVQHSSRVEIKAVAPLIGHRVVKSSSGHKSSRPVITTTFRIGDQEWLIEVTLVNRDVMGFRMLIGRQALRGKCVVDPGRSYLMKKQGGKK